MQVVLLVRIEDHAHVDAAAVRDRKLGDDRRVGEGVDLDEDAPAGVVESALEHGPDLGRRRGLRNLQIP